MYKKYINPIINSYLFLCFPILSFYNANQNSHKNAVPTVTGYANFECEVNNKCSASKRSANQKKLQQIFSYI